MRQALPRHRLRSQGALLTVALLSGACGGNDAPATLASALHLAAAGDPASLAVCERLEIGEGRGICKVDASRTQPDRAAACDAIVRERWRSECWFVYAEDLASGKRWSEAIDACRRAGPFVNDCGRHLWWESQVVQDPVATDLINGAFSAETLAPNCNVSGGVASESEDAATRNIRLAAERATRGAR